MNEIIKKMTWSLWILLILSIIFFVDHHRTVSFNYWLGASHWITKQPLYQSNARGFVYLPQSAVLYLPFLALPFAWGEIIWRILSLSVLSLGLFRFASLLTHDQPEKLPSYFLLLTLIAIPLCFDSARNGQMHLIVTGLLMLATVALSKMQWQKASFLIVLAVASKPTAIVFLLLTAGVFFAETWVYLLAWGVLFLFLPFLTQSWSYVVNQYSECIKMLTISGSVGSIQDWAQLFNLISQTGWNMPMLWQTIVRLIMALIILFTTYFLKKRNSIETASIWLLMLSMIYLMLFNPRTENNDYMMLIPVLSYCFVRRINARKFYHVVFLVGVMLGLVASYYISRIFSGHHNWAAPLMGLLLFVYLCFENSITEIVKLQGCPKIFFTNQGNGVL